MAGSNPRDMAFLKKSPNLNLFIPKLQLLATRRASADASEDPQIKLLLDAKTPVVTIFGKSWLLHVTDVLRTTPEENLAMIEDSVRYLKEQGKEVIYDAEHFLTDIWTTQNMLFLPFLPRKRAERTFLSSAKQMVAN